MCISYSLICLKVVTYQLAIRWCLIILTEPQSASRWISCIRESISPVSNRFVRCRCLLSPNYQTKVSYHHWVDLNSEAGHWLARSAASSWFYLSFSISLSFTSGSQAIATSNMRTHFSSCSRTTRSGFLSLIFLIVGMFWSMRRRFCTDPITPLRITPPGALSSLGRFNFNFEAVAFVNWYNTLS